MNTFLPNDTCATCEKELFNPKAKRVVSYGELLISIGTTSVKFRVFPSEYPVPDGTGRNLYIHGPLWTPSSTARALTSAIEGYHPWVCQACLGLTWKTCGHPSALAVGLDRLDDDGDISYSPHFAGILPRLLKGCVDERCVEHWARHRDFRESLSGSEH